MKLAIHNIIDTFSERWIDYCERKDIPYKIVNCYKSDIIHQLEDCDALMWHHYNFSAKDTRFAKQLLYALEMSGKTVYPDFRTNWHFDDKLGQKYLLEAIGAPIVPSYTFYSKQDAINWTMANPFPKVFKLRGGSSSQNVRLVKTRKDALHLINKAFGRGFRQYNSWNNLKDRWRTYHTGNAELREVIEGIARLVVSTEYSKTQGRDRGYIYFQDFIPDNTHDIRITYVNRRCFALRRKVRPGDFRASGGGMIEYDMSKIPEKALRIAFNVANRLNIQSAAFDFVTLNGDPFITELSYAFGYDKDQFNHGYWDEKLKYYVGSFDPYGWMVEGVIDSIYQNTGN